MTARNSLESENLGVRFRLEMSLEDTQADLYLQCVIYLIISNIKNMKATIHT